MTVAFARCCRGEDTELVGAVHHVRATPTGVPGGTSVAHLRDRITLVQWLRSELAPGETMLTGACGRRAAGGATRH